MAGEEAIPYPWPHGGSGNHHGEREKDHRGPRREVHSGEFSQVSEVQNSNQNVSSLAPEVLDVPSVGRSSGD